jgi:endothelin-converting enzyme
MPTVATTDRGSPIANILAAPQPKKPDLESTVCLTPACVHASSEILYNLAPNYKEIDPCSNFEELVCGGWDDRHDLRPDQGDAFTGTIMSENSQMLLRHILEAPYPNESKVWV